MLEVCWLILLGSTGSIGQNALEVARAHKIKIEALVAGSNIALLNEQIAEFQPKFIAISDKNRAHEVAIPAGSRLLFGEAGILEILEESSSELVLNALVGFLGLRPSLKALALHKRLALANKESLVAGGAFIDTSRIIPVDSEHFSLSFLQTHRPFSELVITASGGAFRDTPLEAIPAQGVEQALKHPNWSMGRKITVDSASMANKLLEILEARWLFKSSKIDALIERNSLVHALLGFSDGSFSAHIARASMRLPLTYAMCGEVSESIGEPLRLSEIPAIRFEKIDPARYPLWNLKETLLCTPTLGIVFNAANEVAVERFLSGEISFGAIVGIVEKTLAHLGAIPKSIEEVFMLNDEARKYAYTC